MHNEIRIFEVGPPSPDTNSWDGAVYTFTGACTNCSLVRDDIYQLLDSDAGGTVALDVGANDSVYLAAPATLTVDSQPAPGGSTAVPGVNSSGPQSLTVDFTWDTVTFGDITFQYSVDDGVAAPAEGLVGTVTVRVSLDTDGDEVADTEDNCTLAANTYQRDTNSDGYGNWCDADLDNSGFVNFGDLAAFKAAFGTSNADADFDGSGGIVNFSDLARFKALFGAPPGPSCCPVP
jgi:hypothetical protein